MKFKILLMMFAIFFIVNILNAQEINFAVKVNITGFSGTGLNTYQVIGTVIDDNGVWDANNVAANDSLFYLEESIVYAFVVNSRVASGSIVTAQITSVGTLLSSSPSQSLSGQVAIARANDGGYCATPAGLQSPLAWALENRFKAKAGSDAIASLEVYNYLGTTGVLPAVTATQAKATIAKNSVGELSTWNGTAWVFAGGKVDTSRTSNSVASYHWADSVKVSKTIVGKQSATNLVVNGDFSSGTANWRQNAGKWQVVGGKLQKATNLTYRDTFIQDLALQVDTLYRLEYTISNYVSGGVNFNVGGVYGKDVLANGTYVEFFTATKDNVGVIVQDLNNTVLNIDEIKLFKVSKETLNFQADLNAGSNIGLGGVIYTQQNRPILMGYWKNKLGFGIGEWNWQPDQPPVVIGHNAMRNGTGVAIGAFAGSEQEGLGYSTLVGIGAGRRNKVGHLTAYGTGAAQNANSDAAVFGDEAGANATTYPINAFGYYALNQSTTGLSVAMGHEAFRSATTGDNTGLGYQIGFNTTTGRVNGLGSQVGWHNTTGRMIGIGRDAGGGQSTTVGMNTTDVEMIYIGDAAKKANNTVMANSIAIGHGAEVEKSNQVVIGTTNTVENKLYGKLGVGGVTPTTSLMTYANVNAFEGGHFINENTGTSAVGGLRLQSGSNTLEINQASPTHGVWANTSRWISPSHSAFLATGSSNIDFYTNSTLRLRILGTGTVNTAANHTVGGSVGVGGITSPLDALHTKGDYMRLEQLSLNGTTATPTLYGLKFFASGGAALQATIETENSRSNIFESKLRFGVADNTGATKNVMFIAGVNQSVGIGVSSPTEKIDVNGTMRLRALQTGATTDSMVTSLNGVLRRVSMTEVSNNGTQQTEIPTNGAIITTLEASANIIVNPATLLVSATIQLPSNPQAGRVVSYFFGGVVANGSPVVTSLTWSGGTIYGTPPSTISGGDVVRFYFDGNVWRRTIL